MSESPSLISDTSDDINDEFDYTFDIVQQCANCTTDTLYQRKTTNTWTHDVLSHLKYTYIVLFIDTYVMYWWYIIVFGFGFDDI